MNNTLKTFTLCLALLLLCFSAQAQIGNRIGNAIQNAAERAATRQAEQRVEQAVDKAINNAFDKDKDKNQNQQQQGQQQQQQSSDPANTGSANTTLAPVEKPATSAVAQEPTKLESFSQYDFVPGDQIIFYEDFSQDAVGDFPDHWTTNQSGEVRTVNIAPGKWFHPTSPGGFFGYLNALELPENFIVEFDYIYQSEDYNQQHYTFSLFRDDKEFSTDLYPGNQGLHISFTYKQQWAAIGYKDGEYNMDNYSTRNPVDDGVNHVIIWVQRRRVRVYHQGAKTLDLPTLLYQGTTFNRFRFDGWSSYATPFISNIKITTAAPDVRSKLITEGRMISYGINFDSGRDVIKPESYGAIKAIADVLKENPGVKVCVVGHTDSDGNAASNLDLSKRRAAAVKTCLVSVFGIDAALIETDGKGQSEPLAPNNTTEGKAKNRRVEFVKI